MADKKELKEQYKRMKPDMGVIMFKCKSSRKAYLGISRNTKADINSLTFQLKLGSYVMCKNLQNDWKKYGENGFEITVLESLPYDKDESKTDYTHELKLLRDLCAEKLTEFEYIILSCLV